jgi:hypothetical protein
LDPLFEKWRSFAYSQGGRKYPTYNQQEAWHRPIARAEQTGREAYPPFYRPGTWCSIPMLKLSKRQSLHLLEWYNLCLHFSVLLPGSEQGQDQVLPYLYYNPAKGSQVFGWQICVGKRTYIFIAP